MSKRKAVGRPQMKRTTKYAVNATWLTGNPLDEELFEQKLVAEAEFDKLEYHPAIREVRLERVQVRELRTLVKRYKATT